VQLSIDYSKNSELKKLQFLAPGPKMTAVCESDDVKEEKMDTGTPGTGFESVEKKLCATFLYTMWL
jgi:hypothetical protein